MLGDLCDLVIEQELDLMENGGARGRVERKRNRLYGTRNRALRRAAKLRATPRWLTREQLEEITQIYINCPKGYHVDHIHPLRGKGLCGLHVPWNLQYLTARDNVRKSNRL